MSLLLLLLLSVELLLRLELEESDGDVGAERLLLLVPLLLQPSLLLQGRGQHERRAREAQGLLLRRGGVRVLPRTGHFLFKAFLQK